MNRKIFVVGAVITTLLSVIIFLEQSESEITTVNVPTSNATQSTNQAPISSITVTKDKSSYSMGDAIVISGVVNSPIPSTQVTILILDPNNLLLQAERISVSSDGSYKTTIMTTPSIWKLAGTYTVSVQYGISNVKAQTTFYFEG